MTKKATDNIITRGFTEVTVTDQYGDQRTIYRQKGKTLRVKKNSDTVSHVMNRVAAEMTGKRIKAKRIERGLSLDQLLLKAGLAAGPGQGKQRMYEIENAGKNHRGANAQGIRFGTLYALALALECEVWDLLPSTAEIAEQANVELRQPEYVRVAVA